MLKARFNGADAYNSLGFMDYYMGLGDLSAVVIGGKGGVEKFPSVLTMHGNKTIMPCPNEEFWVSENGRGFVRGDICFYSNHAPLFADILASYESHIIWNYSSIVNATVEKWSMENHANDEPRFIVQHTNRVMGSDYLIIKATVPGMLVFLKFLQGSMHFNEWDESKAQLASAIDDAKENWPGKWFMEEKVFAESLAAFDLIMSSET